MLISSNWKNSVISSYELLIVLLQSQHPRYYFVLLIIAFTKSGTVRMTPNEVIRIFTVLVTILTDRFSWLDYMLVNIPVKDEQDATVQTPILTTVLEILAEVDR
jgi:BarA-like signal transduction histidine kinase